eukprot:7271705-Pyramimonas_sp.AAC.1
MMSSKRSKKPVAVAGVMSEPRPPLWNLVHCSVSKISNHNSDGIDHAGVALRLGALLSSFTLPI